MREVQDKDAKKNTMPKLSLQQDITQTPTIGNMLWELSEINNLVEVAGLLHLLDQLKVFGLWPETTKLTSLNKCWLIVLKEIAMEDGPMMVLIPLSGKEEIALKLIIPTMPPMATPANLSLLLSVFLATISSMFIMKALIPLLIVFTTMDLMLFMYMSTTTGVIITTESLKIPTAPTLLITMPLST